MSNHTKPTIGYYPALYQPPCEGTATMTPPPPPPQTPNALRGPLSLHRSALKAARRHVAAAGDPDTLALIDHVLALPLPPGG